MPNYDEKTGIRYGVISPHSINQDALNDIYTNGTDPQYEEAKKELLTKIEEFCDDNAIPFDRVKDVLIDEWNDNYQSDGSGVMDYSDNEYDLHVSGDNFGIFVMKSPYYTYCRGCSPCAPGAGDLDSPLDVDPKYPEIGKTFCLGHEWFDHGSTELSRKCCYRVFRVDNNEEVLE